MHSNFIHTVDLQSDTFNWAQDSNSWLKSEPIADSLFDSPNNDYFSDIQPFEWDESCIDLRAKYSYPVSTLSNAFRANDPPFKWDKNYLDLEQTHSSALPTLFNTDPSDIEVASPTTNSEVTTPPSQSASPKTLPPQTKAPKRRRGHSRKSSTISSKKSPPTSRIPHNMVERKYRNGLNSGMEQLKMSIPSMARWESTNTSPSHPKLSKALVLASAIEYIREIEGERNGLVKKIETMRQ
jgi:hypothetical protein